MIYKGGMDMSNNHPNTNKGITLVALILTIIILLILTMITIRAATGDGILDQTRNARSKWQEAKEKKDSLIQNIEGASR